MKKFLVLTLALLLALAVTAPAMAFTADTSDGSDVPYELDIYLVDYEDNDFFGFTTLPASDRGYAKNEIVAAIVELYVPKGENPNDDGYGTLVFSGDNVSLNVSDNDLPLRTTSNVKYNKSAYHYNKSDDEIVLTIGDKLSGKNTFKWIYFAKVTGDDASLTVSLVDGSSSGSFGNTIVGEVEESNVTVSNSLLLTLSGDDYLILKDKASGAAGRYIIYSDYRFATDVPTGHVFVDSDVHGVYSSAIVINVDKNGKSTGMSIDHNGTKGLEGPFALGVTTGSVLGIRDGAVIKTSGHDYNDVMDVYEDIVEDVFGMDYFLIGNYVRDSFFTGLTSASTLTATVDIKPWTSYVSIPDVVVIDPPKTGDAASVLGFVMVALAAVAAFAVKKVRA